MSLSPELKAIAMIQSCTSSPEAFRGNFSKLCDYQYNLIEASVLVNRAELYMSDEDVKILCKSQKNKEVMNFFHSKLQ